MYKRVIALLFFLLLPLPAHAFYIGGTADVSMGPTTYVGPVATSTMLMNSLSTTAGASMMTRKAHLSHGNSNRLQIVLPNYRIDVFDANILGAETGTGNPITVMEWVEYPTGTYTQIKFSGANSTSISDLSYAFSDWANISIPDKTNYFTWTYVTATSGNNFPDFTTAVVGNPLYTAGGEAANYGTSGVPTTPGAITDNVNGAKAYFPVAILGDTSLPTFALPGDSRDQGVHETADASHDIGDTARSIGPTYAYINMGVSGDRIAAFYSSSKLRMQLMAYCSAILNQLGYNEFNQQQSTAASELAYVQTVAARLAGKPYSVITYEPWSTSTDSWATTGGQTAATGSAQESVANDAIRSGLQGGIGFSEVSDVLSVSRNSETWISNGTAFGYTVDGVHDNDNGASVLKTSGAINPLTLAFLAPNTTSYPSLTMTGIGTNTYVTDTGFGQALSGGFSYVYAIQPGVPPITLECRALSSSIVALNMTACSAGPASILAQANTGFAGLRIGTGSTVFSTTNIVDGNPHHLAVTAGGGNLTLWVDGISTISQTQNYAALSWANTLALGARFFTGFGVGTQSQPWTGWVDEIAVWDIIKYTTTFTPPTAPYTGTETGLMGVWHFDNNLNGTRGPDGF